jgi:bifunctional UDP-N-acetylglucosamine pyrophosphorylase / glucosamine-1-phosphate N-acetyltransferase
LFQKENGLARHGRKLETAFAWGDIPTRIDAPRFGTADFGFATRDLMRELTAMSANARRCLTIVLAAGEGVRMRSARPKVLHELAGRSMLAHVLSAVSEGSDGDIAVVVGADRDDVAAEALKAAPGASIAVQRERLGTAHAVLAARERIQHGYDDIVVVYADAPLIAGATLAAMRAGIADGADVVALGFKAADPTGYGRLIERDGRLIAIREHKDASPEEKALPLCNAGPIGFAGAEALKLLEAVTPNNTQKEYYLTDIVEIANARGLVARTLIAEENEVMGVNDRAQLAAAEAALQDRLRRRAMAEGATLVAPETLYLSFDVKIGRDVLIEPYVVIGRGVKIEDGAVIHAFSHLEGARVAGGASVGPFARLRPGAEIAANAKIGNFVEIKQAAIEEGAKVNHLSDIGDARVGAGANIGAGTITCNYDGFSKHKTDIGAGAFIGSNSALVAPVTIGEGAYVGSGSVITKPVEADALAVSRGRQEARAGWAKAFRIKHKKG